MDRYIKLEGGVNVDLKEKKEKLIEEYNKAINTIRLLDKRAVELLAQINLLNELEGEESKESDE
jgi:hypothetical protein